MDQLSVFILFWAIFFSFFGTDCGQFQQTPDPEGENWKITTEKSKDIVNYCNFFWNSISKFGPSQCFIAIFFSFFFGADCGQLQQTFHKIIFKVFRVTPHFFSWIQTRNRKKWFWIHSNHRTLFHFDLSWLNVYPVHQCCEIGPIMAGSGARRLKSLRLRVRLSNRNFGPTR